MVSKQYRIRAQDYTESLIPDAILDVNDPAYTIASVTDVNQPMSLSNFITTHNNINTLPPQAK
jgi:hypothetical protein